MTALGLRALDIEHTAPFEAPAEEKPIGAEELHDRLQGLVRLFWAGVDQQDGAAVLDGLQTMFRVIVHEAGRIDGVARLFGVDRDGSMDLLREAYVAGKRGALESHHESNPDCPCTEAKVLEHELNGDA